MRVSVYIENGNTEPVRVWVSLSSYHCRRANTNIEPADDDVDDARKREQLMENKGVVARMIAEKGAKKRDWKTSNRVNTDTDNRENIRERAGDKWINGNASEVSTRIQTVRPLAQYYTHKERRTKCTMEKEIVSKMYWMPQQTTVSSSSSAKYEQIRFNNLQAHAMHTYGQHHIHIRLPLKMIPTFSHFMFYSVELWNCIEFGAQKRCHTAISCCQR